MTPTAQLSTARSQQTRQRLDALARANEIRAVRSQLKADIKAGRVDVRELLMRPPETLETLDTMRLMDLLRAIPMIGSYRASLMMRRCHASPSKTIGELSGRQRAALVEMLP